MASCSCTCSNYRPIISAKKSDVVNRFLSQLMIYGDRRVKKIPRICVVRASAVDSSSHFVERIEKAWLISKVLPFSINFRFDSCLKKKKFTSVYIAN